MRCSLRNPLKMRLKSSRMRSSYSSWAGLPDSIAPTSRSRSAPAEKLPPAPVRMATRIVGVGVDEVPGVAQAAQHLGVEGVALLGPVQGDGEDVAVTLHEHCGFGHGGFLSGRRTLASRVVP